MNWKLLFQLSVFGVIMAFGTVALIPQNMEPPFWIIIFVFCAFTIAKTCYSKYFLHGFVLSLINSLWITVIHIYRYDAYIAHHPNMNPSVMGLPAYLGTHPRLAMVLMAIPFGVAFGLIQGLFAWIASKFVKKEEEESAA